MGLSSAKKTTTSNQTGSTMPNAPSWVTDAAHGYTDRVNAFGNTDPNQYVAPAAPLQQQAWDNVSHLSDWRPQAATASGLALNAGTQGANTAGKPMTGGEFVPPRVATGEHAMYAKPTHPGELPAPNTGMFTGSAYSPPPDMPGYAGPRTPVGGFNPALTGAEQAGAYSNPFENDVINTTLANSDADTAARRAQLEAAGAGSGAFGGSRWGIAEGTFDSNAARDRAAQEASLRSSGFDKANALGMQDAAAGNTMNMFNATQQDNALNRELAAAGLLGQQASQYGADTRADIGTMAGLGEQQRGIEQQYASAPLDQLLAQGQLLGQIPYNALVGQNVTSSGKSTEKSSSSLFSQLLQLGQAAAMFA